MIGETPRSNPTVQIPPWDCHNEHPTANIYSPFSFTSPQSNASSFNGLTFDNLTAFHRYLPSNTVPDDIISGGINDLDIPVDTLSCEEFRMYEFKVKKCTRARSHDWTECPYAHPGEKARRRDPRKYHYSGSACSDFRKGACRKGDSCEYAHGVFEFWLHPARYRTQPCKDGTNCRRRTCFFAHTTDQLRILPSSESYDESTGRRIGCNNAPRFRCLETTPTAGNWAMDSSPTSVLHSPPSPPPYDSPPLSPTYSVNYLTGSMRNIQIGSRRLMTTCSMNNPGIYSPRSPIPMSTRPGFMSLPSTPNRNPTRSGLVAFELWDNSFNEEEEPIMERVESGKDLRAKIYAKLSKENSLDSSADSGPGTDSGPDLGWISELVK